MHVTERQAQVLAVYATGLTKAQVGKRLFITENTVKKHLARISRQTGARSSMHAFSISNALGLLDERASCPPVDSSPKLKRGRPYRAPLPADLAERYPSTAWGEKEWAGALIADDNLFFRILRGIGKASQRR